MAEERKSPEPPLGSSPRVIDGSSLFSSSFSSQPIFDFNSRPLTRSYAPPPAGGGIGVEDGYLRPDQLPTWRSIDSSMMGPPSTISPVGAGGVDMSVPQGRDWGMGMKRGGKSIGVSDWGMGGVGSVFDDGLGKSKSFGQSGGKKSGDLSMIKLGSTLSESLAVSKRDEVVSEEEDMGGVEPPSDYGVLAKYYHLLSTCSPVKLIREAESFCKNNDIFYQKGDADVERTGKKDKKRKEAYDRFSLSCTFYPEKDGGDEVVFRICVFTMKSKEKYAIECQRLKGPCASFVSMFRRFKSEFINNNLAEAPARKRNLGVSIGPIKSGGDLAPPSFDKDALAPLSFASTLKPLTPPKPVSEKDQVSELEDRTSYLFPMLASPYADIQKEGLSSVVDMSRDSIAAKVLIEKGILGHIGGILKKYSGDSVLHEEMFRLCVTTLANLSSRENASSEKWQELFAFVSSEIPMNCTKEAKRPRLNPKSNPQTFIIRESIRALANISTQVNSCAISEKAVEKLQLIRDESEDVDSRRYANAILKSQSISLNKQDCV